MEEEQMVGVVTHLIGQNQGLVHMAEILAAVVDSKAKLKKLADAAKAQQALLDGMKKSTEDAKVAGEKQKADLQAKLAKVEASSKAELDKILAEVAVKKQNLEASIASLTQAEKDAKDRVQAVRDQVAQYEKLSAEAQSEYERVKKVLSNLTASIKV